MSKWFYKLNILQRLLFYFLIVIIVSVSIVSVQIYSQASTEIRQQQSDYLEYIVRNATYQTNLFIQDFEYTTLPLINNDRIKNFLEIADNDRLEYYYHHIDIKKMMNDLLIQNEDINLVFLIGENRKSILSDGRLTLDEEESSFNNIYNNLLKTTPESGATNITLNKSLNKDKYVLTMTRNVRGRRSFVPMGVLGLEIEATALAKLWDITKLKNRALLWIFDENNRIVYHPSEQWLGKEIDESLKQHFISNEGTFNGMWETEKMTFYYDKLPETNWTLVAMSPQQKIYEPLAGLNEKVITAIIISLLIALVLSIGFANSIVKPLRKVQKGMKQTEEGDWVKITPLKGTDEISSVVLSYNMMIDKLANLLKNLTDAELRNHRVSFEKQSIEFQALQAQINPHFLHNTLETMNAYATINNEIEISEMTVALSQMFRYAVHNLEVVTIEEEIEHVNNFLVIAKHRFQQEVKVQFDIDPRLYNEEIVKLTMQPLVENAIHHGLKKNKDKGELIIRVSKNECLLKVEINDNGSGITPERLEELRRAMKQKDNNQIQHTMGIGLSNVNRRIQLIFGDRYGLHIYSELGQGTTVIMEIPK